MHILMPCRSRVQPLRTCREILEKRGVSCTLYPYTSADKLRRTIRSAQYDLLLTAESAVLPRKTALSVPTVYLGTDFFCTDAHLPSGCDAYWIAQEELAFDFMTHGAQEKRVHVCGVPLREIYLRKQTRSAACRALGVGDDATVFSFLTDGVSPNEIKAAVHACGDLCPDATLLLWSTDGARRSMWQTMFADLGNVYVPDADDPVPIALAACDVLFTAAFPEPVCGAARMGKNLILLHAPSPRLRRNAAFLDAHGIAFCGKTAADNVSYACRLFSSVRLQQNMRAAQEKYIIRDAEQRLESLVRDAQQRKKE